MTSIMPGHAVVNSPVSAFGRLCVANRLNSARSGRMLMASNMPRPVASPPGPRPRLRLYGAGYPLRIAEMAPTQPEKDRHAELQGRARGPPLRRRSAIESISFSFPTSTGGPATSPSPPPISPKKPSPRGSASTPPAWASPPLTARTCSSSPTSRFAFLDPVEPEAKILYFLCDILDIGTEESFSQDLRHIVWKAVAALREEGVADAVQIGLELEFYVLDELFSTMTTRETSYRVESGELASPPGGADCTASTATAATSARSPTTTTSPCGTKSARRRADRPGSEVPPSRSRQFAVRDRVQVSAGRVHGRRHDVGQAHLPPGGPQARQDHHVHSQADSRRGGQRHARPPIPVEGGQNVFHDDAGLYKLSPLALHYIGGLLSHPGSLVALTNPTTNSYRRLIPGFEAPVKAVFAEGNRSAAIRIPAYVKDPQERRFEFRTIDATCNPYLAYAAMIMAGLDGVRRKIDPVAAGFGPTRPISTTCPRRSSTRSIVSREPRDRPGGPATRPKLPDPPRRLPGASLGRVHRRQAEGHRRHAEGSHPWEIARYYDILRD